MKQFKDYTQADTITMFDNIADNYDNLNRILSFGIDIYWRKIAVVKALRLYNQDFIEHILDIACGSGDMLLQWHKVANKKSIKVKQYTGIDYSKNMLAIAAKKLDFAELRHENAAKLSLASESANIISITYGIRNVKERLSAFEHFYRILKPQGLLVIAEFMTPQKLNVIQRLARIYMKHILPCIGNLISKNQAAYAYLPDSIQGFITMAQMQTELESIGFKKFLIQGFSFDISTLFIMQKP